MSVSRSSKSVIAALCITLLLLSGAEGCQSGDGDLAQQEPKPIDVPRPNPDTRPDLPRKTPGPIAGDPNPHDRKIYTLIVAWHPTSDFVSIDWKVGSSGALFSREHRGGEWSETVEINGKAVPASISADWTQSSWDSIKRRKVTSFISCKILVNNQIRGPSAAKETGGRGLDCSVLSSDVG